MTGRKRLRAEKQEQYKEHPFYISYPRTTPKPRAKRRRESTSQHGLINSHGRTKLQTFPFTWSITDSLDLLYVVRPKTAWQEMTSYKSFILRGLKHKLGDFVFIANEQTIKRQKINSGQATQYNEEWVARILEVRALDANNVYARVHWMYRPDEIPLGTLCRGKKIEGRQPYHGDKELILSNHMDIINVLSVLGPAKVEQWVEGEGDKERQRVGPFWRQVYNWCESRLSSLDSKCICRVP
jgi:hypothetical protein